MLTRLRALLDSLQRRFIVTRADLLTTRGTSWGQNSLRGMFCRIAARVGIAGATFHHLRHGFVTALLVRGVGAHVVKELAGHADLTTTERYAHARRSNKRAAIDAREGPKADGGDKSKKE